MIKLVIVCNIPSMFRGYYWAILPLLVLGGALLWGLFVYDDSSKKNEPKSQVEAVVAKVTQVPVTPIAIKPEESSQSPKEATTSSQKEETLSKYKQSSKSSLRSDFKIKVLNGTEVKGEASRIRDYLVREGYSVSLVGNAQDSDYKETSIQVDKDVSAEFITILKGVLGKELILSSEVKVVKIQDSDVMVIIGSGKAAYGQ